MKKTFTCVLAVAFVLQGCSALDMNKFGFGLEQRKDVMTNQTSNSFTPMLTYKSDFGGDNKIEKLDKSKTGLQLDGEQSANSDNLLLIGLGALVIGAAAGKKSASTPAKTTPVCSSTTLPFPPYISTVCN